MIADAILYIIYGIVYLLCQPILLLSNVTLPSGLTSALTTASGYIHALNVILPIDTILAILGVSLALELAYLTFKIIMWVIRKIPTIN